MTYEGIIICRCGHGKPHHNSEFGHCTCPIESTIYPRRICPCQSLDVVKTIIKGRVTLQEEC